MKTAEEIINSIVKTGFDFPDAVNLIKEYAKEVAQQALKSASENATMIDKGTPYFNNYSIDKQSILETQIITP